MSSAKMTLLGLQKYMVDFGDDLFSDLILPTGIDKDILVNNIFLNGGEFEVLYSDPHFLKLAIQLWGKKWYRTFEKWVSVLSIPYAPLENYDRFEDYTDTTDKDISTSSRRDNENTRTFNNQDQRTLNTKDKRTPDLTTTNEEQVSAFDSSTYQPSKKTTIEEDGTDTMDHTGTDTLNYTGTIGDVFGESINGSEGEDVEFNHTGRTHGNIGTMTTQNMLLQELDVSLWNIYEHITDLFLSEFVIPIYT